MPGFSRLYPTIPDIPRVIYPRGVSTKFAVAQARDYETSELDLAPRETFGHDEEHDLTVEDDRTGNHAFLD